MAEYITNHYLLIKALHIISIICWMAGILYLPRLYVYHTRAERNSDLDLTLQIMERKLLRIIMNPSMIASILSGGMLVYIIGFNVGIWLHIKLLLVLMMAALHGMLAKYRKNFECGNNTHSEKYYRIFNELPAMLMVVIVLLVVIKPF